MTFQLVVSFLPWIPIGCALFLVLWFVLDLKMRLFLLWYSISLSILRRRIRRAYRQQSQEFMEEKDPEEMVTVVSVHPEWKD